MRINRLARALCDTLIFVISVILLGAYLYQYFTKQQPCPLCELQRVAFIGVAIGALMNLRFGSQTQHYAISLLSAIFGGAVSLRQICLHICPGFPTFGSPVLGLSLYTWAFIGFVCSIFAISLMLFFCHPVPKEFKNIKMNIFSKIVFALIFLLCVANFLTALSLCGLGPCTG